MGNGKERSPLSTFWVENKKIISLSMAVIALLVFLFCLVGAVMPDVFPEGSDPANIIDNLEGWIWWILVGSGIVLFVFGWIFYDYYKKEKRYNELMDTESKSEFIKNREELEYTASALGPKFEDKVFEKAEELNIK